MTAHTEITGARVLSVPPHIRGRLRAEAPVELRRERYQWVCGAIAAGYTKAQISRLLGITKVAVGDIVAKGEPGGQPKPAQVIAPVVVESVLTAPAHICGPLNSQHRERLADRTRWVREQIECGHSQATIARALGIDRCRISDISGQVERGSSVRLAATPWDADGERPAIRQTLVRPVKRRGLTVEGVIAIIRAECLKARAESGEQP